MTVNKFCSKYVGSLNYLLSFLLQIAQPKPVSTPSFKSDQTVEHPIYVAKYDYDSRADDDLGFKKGDLLYAINTSDDDWWYARSKDSGREGYIPSSYVTSCDSLDAQEYVMCVWWLGWGDSSCKLLLAMM